MLRILVTASPLAATQLSAGLAILECDRLCSKVAERMGSARVIYDTVDVAGEEMR